MAYYILFLIEFLVTSLFCQLPFKNDKFCEMCYIKALGEIILCSCNYMWTLLPWASFKPRLFSFAHIVLAFPTCAMTSLVKVPSLSSVANPITIICLLLSFLVNRTNLLFCTYRQNYNWTNLKVFYLLMNPFSGWIFISGNGISPHVLLKL